MTSEYDRIRAMFPDPAPCDIWHRLRNGFEGMITHRGAVRLRRRVRLAGLARWEVFAVTRRGGIRSTGFAPRDDA